MDKRVREISRFFVAPRREFAPAVWGVPRTLLSRNTSTSCSVDSLEQNATHNLVIYNLMDHPVGLKCIFSRVSCLYAKLRLTLLPPRVTPVRPLLPVAAVAAAPVLLCVSVVQLLLLKAIV